MTNQDRYELIKNICESKSKIDSVGVLPYDETDVQDEMSRFNTSCDSLAQDQDSEQWQDSFLQDLVFGS